MGKRLLGTSVSKQMCRLALLFSVTVFSVEAATSGSCGRASELETTKESTIYLGKCTHVFVEETEYRIWYRRQKIAYQNEMANSWRNSQLDHAQLANMDRKFSYVGSVEPFDVKDPSDSSVTTSSPRSLDEVWENSQGYRLAKIPFESGESGRRLGKRYKESGEYTEWILYAPVERWDGRDIRRPIMFAEMKSRDGQALTFSDHAWTTFSDVYGQVICQEGADAMVNKYGEILPPVASLEAALKEAKGRARAAAELVRQNDPVSLRQEIQNLEELYQNVDAKLKPIEDDVRSFEEDIQFVREDISQLQEDRPDELAELKDFIKYDKEKLRSLKPLHGSLERRANVLKVVLQTTQLAEAKARQQPSTLLNRLKYDLRTRESEVEEAKEDLKRWRAGRRTYREYVAEELLSDKYSAEEVRRNMPYE